MKFKISLLFVLTVLVSKIAWGQTATITITNASIGGSAILGTNAYNGGAERVWNQNTVSFGGKAITCNPSSTPAGSNACQYIQAQASNGVIYNKTALPGRLVSVQFIGSASVATSLFGGNATLVNATAANYTITGGTQIGTAQTATGYTWTTAPTDNYTFFCLKRGATAQYFSSIIITYEITATTTYSLTYNGNGNTSGTAPVDPTSPYASGATVTTLGNTGSLAKTGNTFVGWNTAANGSGASQAVGSTFNMPAANTVLYAQWTTNNYSVSFDANTGSGTMSNQTIAYGATANLVANTFTNSGYTFAGWNTASNGSGTTYADGANLTMGSSNITLFAQWTPIITTPIAQTITFNPLSNQFVGVADYSPGATASSGLTVTYTSSNPSVATISGGLIHVVGPGTTTITASQAGNASYLAANDVSQNLIIMNAPQVLAAWDFTGENNVVTSLADTYLSSVIYQPNLTRGNGAQSSSGNNSFRTVGFKNEGISLSNTDYFETAIISYNSTLSLTSIDAQFAGTSTFVASPGVTSQFAYSLDGTNFTFIGSPIQTTSLILPQVDLSAITALQNLQLGTTITFRYYASGQTTTGGWGFNSSSSGVYGFLIKGYAENSGTALPVEFLDFTATCNETKATELKWSTASEHNADYYKIEKSIDGLNWSMLSKLAAAGNTTERMEYSIVDIEKTRGSYYKLWQYDVDGTANLLATIQESCAGLTGSSEPIIYPNPITDQELTIELRNDKVEFITVQIYSMQGTLVYSQQMQANEQITLTKLNIEPGVYQLILQLDAGSVSNYKICVK